MKWRIIVRDKSNQPATGKYSDWKEIIAEYCHFQCVYCSIHEEQFGGITNYHIDHFRPKSKKEFEHLTNDILNLYYACPICNRFKKDDWPGEPDDLNKVCYPDPSDIDYSELFTVNEAGGYLLESRFISANYVIERLYLNRAQLLFERREYMLNEREKSINKELKDLEEKIVIKDNEDTIRKGLQLKSKTIEILLKRKSIRPYRKTDIQRS